jgi:phosphoribosylformylglycinamidine synthase
MKAKVYVTLKNGVLDPQGKAIEGALKAMKINGIDSVKQGKMFEIEGKSEAQIRLAAEKLLANMVIENYKIEIL